jgi:hypothetical protein
MLQAGRLDDVVAAEAGGRAAEERGRLPGAFPVVGGADDMPGTQAHAVEHLPDLAGVRAAEKPGVSTIFSLKAHTPASRSASVA